MSKAARRENDRLRQQLALAESEITRLTTERDDLRSGVEKAWPLLASTATRLTELGTRISRWRGHVTIALDDRERRIAMRSLGRAITIIGGVFGGKR